MPKPDYHVFVCGQARPPGHPRGSCAEKNGGEVLETFFAELQARNLFDKVQVTAAGCMGPCGEGPSVLVYPEGTMYGKVTKDDVAEIFDSHFGEGNPVERLRVPAAVWG